MRPSSRPPGLGLPVRQAAAAIFVLSGLLPLLVLLAILWHHQLTARPTVQLGLLLALLIALLGFALARQLADRVGRLAATLRRGLVRRDAPPPAPGPAVLAGLGPIAELGDIARALSRLLGELREAVARGDDLAAKMATLNEMADVLARIPRIEDLVGHVLERAMQAVGATAGSIMLVDPERLVLRVVASRRRDGRDLVGAEVPLGEGIAGKAAQSGQPVLVRDIETDIRFARSNDPRYGSPSFVCVPLRVGDRLIGVVNLAAKMTGTGPAARASTFTTADLEFVRTLTLYAAYAIDNARLLHEARQAAERLHALLAEADAPGMLVAPPPPAAPGERGRELAGLAAVVVAHDPLVLDMVATYLASAGCRVRACETAEAALAALDDAADVVIADAALAGVPELSRRLAARSPRLREPVVLVTGEGLGEEERPPLPPELAERVLPEPFTRRELVEAVAARLPRRSPRRQPAPAARATS